MIRKAGLAPNASQLTLLNMFGGAVIWPPPPRAGED